ncbi:MAG TPA: thioesterase domain-containing protein, partial [Acidimicrobiales bacterium]|nr:thioesterase domain-containing protein [Acidimicrobiales bacterium]
GALVPIQPRGTKRPLFCVHGGAGTILLFQPLARRLGPDQPLYGLQAVGLYGGEAPQRSVRAMAERYVREMRSVQPGGPYRVAGYCFGALVAYEMACQLKAADEWTELLISFNGPSPSYIARYRPLFDREGALRDEHGETVERARRRKPSLGSDLRHQLVGDGTVAERLSRTGAEAYRRARREAASRAQRARLELYLSLGRPLPDSLRENSNFQRIAKRAQDAYRPRPFPGGMLVVSGQGLYHSDDLGWSEHALGFVEAFLVPGRQPVPRRTMAEPWIGAVAERIGAALDALEPS